LGSTLHRGDNAGLHLVYSGTVAAAREGAIRGHAVGIAVSLNTYSRSADYAEAGRLTADLVTAIAATPGRGQSRCTHCSLCHARVSISAWCSVSRFR